MTPTQQASSGRGGTALLGQAEISGVNGTVVHAKQDPNTAHLTVGEMVHVGHARLIGEIIHMGETLTIQVYEETIGLRAGEPVYGTGGALSITLGPGLMGQVFDGVGRNLNHMGLYVGDMQAVSEPLWPLTWQVEQGERVEAHQTIAVVQETPLIKHPITSPVGGQVVWVAEGSEHPATATIAHIQPERGEPIAVTMSRAWPVKVPRPVKHKRPVHEPLLTGQRVIDTLFPIAKGGAGAIPGGFGTGKTMTMTQVAKHAACDVLVYVGCGERGNEIKGMLDEFSHLTDTRTGRSLMERTVIIANTSNMPVSAREASIYTGITIAEYYRDMGCDVLLIADSTSRFAEGLRELSGRLMEMPAEEGYPAYLSARLASFYERAGAVTTLGGGAGSVTVLGSVSPQGGDMNDIVTLNTKRYVRCLWELDPAFAHARHFPAVNYHNSYSEYSEVLSDWYNKNAPRHFATNRRAVLAMLETGAQLENIVKLIGEEVLHDSQKLTLDMCQLVKQGFLQQNAMIARDAYTSLEIQTKLIEIMLYLHDTCSELVNQHIPMSVMRGEGIFAHIRGVKDSAFNYPSDLNVYFGRIDRFKQKLIDLYFGQSA